MRPLPDPGHGSDDGSAPPAVADALRQVADGAPLEVALAALCEVRVLVPVVAVPGQVEYDESGLARDKTADMATVLLTGRDGRRALLAFTDLAALQAWDPAARPAPVSTRQAAQAALAEGADALVVDVAGPVQVPIEGDALHRLVRGQRLLRSDDGFVWVAPLAERR